MYAIIRAGGHQEKVEAGDTITVDRLKDDVGAEVSFVPLVIGKDDGSVVSDKAELEAGAVVGTVLDHVKGDKVDIFQYRQKTNYRRHVGHRQPMTLVEIAEIRLGDSVSRGEEVKAARAEAEARAAEERKAAEAERRAAAEAKAKAKAAKKAKSKKTPPKAAPAKTGKKRLKSGAKSGSGRSK